VNPRFLSKVASYDAASNICEALGGGGPGAQGGFFEVGPGGLCSARHVIGCRLTQETRVQNMDDDVASIIRHALL